MTKIALALLAFIVFSLCAISQAGATTIKYSAFGNKKLGDCTFVAAANLVQHEYPGAPITEAEVVTPWESYWNDNGIDAQAFMATTGFAGHTATLTQLVNPSRVTLIYDANHGGLYAWVNLSVHGDTDNHAMAIIGANNTTVRAVWYGVASNESWKSWGYLKPFTYWSVTWTS